MAKDPAPGRDVSVDNVTHWAINGGGGWLNILRQQQKGGVRFSDQAIADLTVLNGVIVNLIRVNRGEDPWELPGGASDLIAHHFYALK